MERETLVAISAGAGAAFVLIVELIFLRYLAWWDRRQAQDHKP